MIGRFLDAGHRVSWVAGDEVNGGNPKLRSALEEHGVGYVLAIACSAEVTTGAGKFRADALAARGAEASLAEAVGRGRRQGPPLPRRGRHRPGRTPARRSPAADPPQPHHRRARLLPLLVTRPGAPDHPGPHRRVEMAGGGVFQAGKGLAGLDEHQVRRFTSWSRWVSLAMLDQCRAPHMCRRMPEPGRQPGRLTRAHPLNAPTRLHQAAATSCLARRGGDVARTRTGAAERR